MWNYTENYGKTKCISRVMMLLRNKRLEICGCKPNQDLTKIMFSIYYEGHQMKCECQMRVP